MLAVMSGVSPLTDSTIAQLYHVGMSPLVVGPIRMSTSQTNLCWKKVVNSQENEETKAKVYTLNKCLFFIQRKQEKIGLNVSMTGNWSIGRQERIGDENLVICRAGNNSETVWKA